MSPINWEAYSVPDESNAIPVTSPRSRVYREKASPPVAFTNKVLIPLTSVISELAVIVAVHDYILLSVWNSPSFKALVATPVLIDWSAIISTISLVSNSEPASKLIVARSPTFVISYSLVSE